MKSEYVIAFFLSLLIHAIFIKIESISQVQTEPIRKSMLSLRIVKREKIVKDNHKKNFIKKEIETKCIKDHISKKLLNNNTSKEVLIKHKNKTLNPIKNNNFKKNVIACKKKNKFIENINKNRPISKDKTVEVEYNDKKVLLSDKSMISEISFVKAREKYSIIPKYPRKSRRLGEEGIVTVKATIDLQGRVINTVILSSSGFERLDNAAVNAVNKAEFYPAKSNGIPVMSYRNFLFRFLLDDE